MSLFSKNVTHDSMPDAIAYLVGEVQEMKSLIRKGEEKTENETFDKEKRRTRSEVCKHYSISLPTLHKEMRNGLPFEKIGRKTVFQFKETDNYFKHKKGSKYESI